MSIQTVTFDSELVFEDIREELENYNLTIKEKYDLIDFIKEELGVE